MKRLAAIGLSLAAGLGPGIARAQADAGSIWASCSEHVPPGASRPQMSESFPDRGISGYASTLVVMPAPPMRCMICSAASVTFLRTSSRCESRAVRCP